MNMTARAGAAEPVAPVARDLRVVLVDPSLFTAAYDAALGAGLAASGVAPLWAVRRPRAGEECEIPAAARAEIFYPGAEGSAKGRGLVARLRKGGSHVASSRRLLGLVAEVRPDVVHFQWAVLPLVDVAVIGRLARRRPVVVTVHDTVPFNGAPTSRLQLIGHGALLRSADRLIVHTRHGAEALRRLGCAPERVRVIPHGPLSPGAAAGPPAPRTDPRWTFVLFGRLQPYKGVDRLVAAVGALDPATRAGIRVIVAGEAFIDLAALRRSIAEAGLAGVFEIRPGRQSAAGMQALFAEADTFVFPYRHIEASGVYHLVRNLGKWIVASRLGCFAEELDPARGTLVPADDDAALAAALGAAVGRTPEAGADTGPDWTEIGRRTRALYDELLAGRAGAR